MDKYYKLIKLYPEISLNWETGMILYLPDYANYAHPVLTKYINKSISKKWLENTEYFEEVLDIENIEKVYSFYIDKKQSIWVRDYYNILAKSYEEAEQKIKLIFNGKIEDGEYFNWRDTLFDTGEDLELSKEHYVTKECFNEESESLIISNKIENGETKE